MIEERATILDTRFNLDSNGPSIARVSVQRTNTCGSCSLKSGCGQSTLNKMTANRCLELDIENTLGARPGDEVFIAIPEQGLISASLRVYLFPLVLLILGAVIGDLLSSGQESVSMICALTGLLLGFFWARAYSRKHAYHKDYLPVMTRLLISQYNDTSGKQSK